MSQENAQIEITAPKVFTTGAVAITYAHGLLLVAPVFAAFLVVTVLPLGALTLLVLAVAIGLTVLFLPFGFGNAYVTRLASKLKGAAEEKPGGFFVQVTLSPRIHSGLRAVLEDADDVGWLSLTGSEVVYRGDSVKLSIPFNRIAAVRSQNVGRGLFLYGGRVVVSVSDLPNVTELAFSERSSWWLPTSRKIAGLLRQRLEAVKAA
jgi:hypothetical protein